MGDATKIGPGCKSGQAKLFLVCNILETSGPNQS